MRILVVSGSRSLCLLLDQVFQYHALTAEVVTPEVALAACDRPVILYHAARWTTGSSKMVQRLGEQTAALFVVCPDVLRPAVRLAIIQRGAWDGFPADRTSLRILAMVMQRLMVQEMPTRLEWAALVLDVLQGTLSTAEHRHSVTPAEIRLLEALWPTAGAQPGTGLPGQALAELARVPARTVRNHVDHLRLKLEDVTDGSVALVNQRGCGYRLALQCTLPPSSEEQDAR